MAKKKNKFVKKSYDISWFDDDPYVATIDASEGGAFKDNGGNPRGGTSVHVIANPGAEVMRFQDMSGAATDKLMLMVELPGGHGLKFCGVHQNGSYVIQNPDGSEIEFVLDRDGARLL